MKALNLAGQKFYRLTPRSVVTRRSFTDRSRAWECVCDCGNIVVVSTNWLRTGHAKSCGCLKREVMREKMSTHGMSGKNIYRIWAGMVARCKPNDVNNRVDYYDRGIAVCEQWKGKNGFVTFFADVGDRPSKKHSIDRIDCDGGYEPSNVRWATSKEQVRNRRIRRIEDFTDAQLLAEMKRRGLV